MAIDPVLDQTVNAINIFQYENYITDSLMYRPEMEFFNKLMANGIRSKEAPQGKGRVWATNKQARMSGGYPNNSGDLTGITTAAPDFYQLSQVYDEFFLRSQVAGYEIYDGTGSLEQINKYMDVYRQIYDGAAKYAGQVLPAIAFGTGTGLLANYAGAGQTINAGVTGSVVVDFSNRLLQGIQVEKFTDLHVSEGVFRVIDTPFSSSRTGSDTIQLKNETGGNLAITSGGYFAPVGANKSKAQGLQWMLSDGTTVVENITDETDYDYYPRRILDSNGANINTSIQRSATTGVRSYRSKVLNGATQPLSSNLLDQALAYLVQFGKPQKVQYGDGNNQIVGYNYYIICAVSQLMSIQRENRAIGRAYDLSVNGVEDNGLRRTAYGGFPFMLTEMLPPNTVYIPYLPDFECSLKEPIPYSRSEMGPFQRIPGTSNWEYVGYMRWHFLGYELSNSLKMVGTTGFTG